MPQAVKEMLQVRCIDPASKLVTDSGQGAMGRPAILLVFVATLLNQGKQRETTNWFSLFFSSFTEV